MIASFADRATSDLYHGHKSKVATRIPLDLRASILRKLDMLNSSQTLQDLLSPPGNRLESLKGKLRGFHSIRVNDQWRIVFRWEQGEAHDVELMDYHS